MRTEHPAIQITEITANELTFRCRTCGDRGEPVILLHGFPETSHLWEPLMLDLRDRGYQCIAPDQRGYSPGARPIGIEHYAYPKLAADVLGIADVMGFDRFHLIGHDHGAGVGWTFTHDYPDRVQSWSALSVPHLAAFGDAIRNDPDQSQRSQYIGFFQTPGDAEAALGADDCAALIRIWDKSSDFQKSEYLQVFRQEGALTAALNWYRGAIQTTGEDATTRIGAIHTPTLCLWGNQDGAIGRRSTELAAGFMKGPYRFVELTAGHWLIQEQPERVIQEIRQHLASYPCAG